ncbi:MAG: 50S ribosomal protein L9 [Spirochaetaceae bacterium]|nr:MAG: 50S ribosomal protein L9 [Spirochaetaceae bacterium]
MKVILNRDVPNLGEEGDICEVARGYARNYLIPRNMVLMHNRQNVAEIEGRRSAIEQRKQEKRKEASSIKDRIETEELVIRMAAGERGKLFGSVTTANIVDELEKRGITVERRKVDITESTIKSTGTHSVRVRLYGDEEATLTVRVESETPETEAPKPAEVPAAAGGDEEPAPEATEPEAGEAAVETAAAEPAEADATEAGAEAEADTDADADADSDARLDQSAT